MRLRALAAIAVTVITGLAFAFFTPNAANATGVVFGCGASAPSSPTSDLTGLSYDITTDMGGTTTTRSSTATLSGIDWNADATTDAWIEIDGYTGWSHYYTTYPGGTPTFHYRNNAISMISNYSSIVEIVNDTMGIDYSTYQTLTTTGWYAGQPYSGSANFRQLGLDIKVYDNADGDDLPAGDIELALTLDRASGNKDEFSIGLSTDTATGTSTPWGERTHTVAFLDWENANVFALGTQIEDGSGTVVPASTFGTAVEVEMLEGSTLGLDAVLGFEGVYAETGGSVASTGHPGSAAIAAEIDCATEPHDWVAAGYDDTVTPGLAPYSLTGSMRMLSDSGSGSLDTRTLYADLDWRAPSSRNHVKLSAFEYDFDGDGIADAATDVDGDGVNDLPHSRIDFEHNASAASTTPSLEAVLASEPLESTRETYVAAELAEVPEHLNVDYVGEVVGYDSDGDGDVLDAEDDSDGDGYPDEITTDLDHIRFWVCDVDWGSETCVPGTEATIGDTLLTYTNEVPADDADGNVPAEHYELDAAPGLLSDTAGDFFDVSDPDHYVLYNDDAEDGSLGLTADITGVSHAELHHTNDGTGDIDTHVVVTSSGLGELAVDADIVRETGSEIDVWAMLYDVPDAIDVMLDLDDTDADGDPIHIESITDARTATALWLDMVSTESATDRMNVAGWLGTGDGSSDGLPTRMTIDAELYAGDIDVSIKSNVVATGGDGPAATLAMTTASGGLSEFTPLSDAPAVLQDNAAGHFDPTGAGHYLYLDSDAGSDEMTVAAALAGFQEGSVFLPADPAQDTEVRIDNDAMSKFGLEMHRSVPASGFTSSVTDVWGVLEDVPDSIELTADLSDTDIDGDPITVGWANSATTDAGLSVDVVSQEGSKVEMHAAGWFGTASGTTDGLPADLGIEASFVDATDVKVDTGIASMWGLSPATNLHLGITASTEEQRINGDLRTRVNARATIPDYLAAYLSPDLDRVEIDTCHAAPSWSCDEVTDITVTAVTDPGAPDEQALYGVGMLAIPNPKVDAVGDIFQNSGGHDFVNSAEYARYVNYSDAATDEQGEPVTWREWGFDLALDELTTLGYDMNDGTDTSDHEYRRDAVCFTGAIDAYNTPAGLHGFGIGIFKEGDGADNTYIDAAMTLDNPARPDIRLQAHVHMPSEASGGRIADLTATQETNRGDHPLVETLREDCPNLTSHGVDPAPMTGSGADPGPAHLYYNVHMGTFDELVETLTLASRVNKLPAVTQPAGSDVTIYNSDAEGGIDTAGKLGLPRRFKVEQPVLKTCVPGGNQDITTCTSGDAHSQVYATTLDFAYAASGGVDFGDLDAEYMSDKDDSTTPEHEVARIEARLDRIPDELSVEASLQQRMRDNLTDVDLEIADGTGSSLEPIEFSYLDETNPGLLADPELSTHADNIVPNYELSLTNLLDRLEVHASMLVPGQGPAAAPYKTSDCTGWSTPGDKSNIYSTSSDFDVAGWSPTGARSSDPEDAELRPVRVAAEIDLLQASRNIDILVDARRDSSYKHQDYDYIRDSAKVAYETDNRSSGEIEFLYPGMQTHLAEDKTFAWIPIADLETCLDIDIPATLTWTDASRLSLGLNSMKGTITMDESELGGGADAEISFGETYYDNSGTETTAEGFWANEVLTRWMVLGTKYNNNIQQEHYAIDFVDPDRPKNTYLNSRQYNELSMSDMTGGLVWDSEDTDAGGDEHYAGFMFDPLFHFWVDYEMILDGGLINEYNRLWKLAAESSSYMADMDCSSGNCGDPITDWYDDHKWAAPDLERWELPEIGSAGASGGSWNPPDSWECYGEDLETSGTVATLDDGTEIMASYRWGGGGRFELYVQFNYASGEVRYIEELVDTDITTAGGGAIWCHKYDVDLDIDVNDWTIDLDVDRKKGMIGFQWLARWKDLETEIDGSRQTVDDTWSFDRSGNMGRVETSTPVAGIAGDGSVVGDTDGDGLVDTTPAPVRSADELTLIGLDAGSFERGCTWNMGDGAAIPVESDSVIEYTYSVPGTYQVHQVCWEEEATESGKGNHMPLRATSRTLVVDVH